MFNIGEYLKKFSTQREKNNEAVEVFKKIITNLGINTENLNIKYDGKKIKTNGPNIAKNIIYIKKETILKELKEKGVVVTDVT